MEVQHKRTVNTIPAEEFAAIVAGSKTWTEVARKCGYNNTGNCSIIKKRCAKDNVDTRHLPVGHNWAEGLVRVANKRYTNEEVFVENSTYLNGNQIKNRLYKHFGWEKKCNICKLDTWMGHPIPIELDHISGVHTDNRIENLRLLCATCHAQTDTYKGKNVNSYKNT